ncbi:DUF3616 domain-containing protein [Leucobacter weissii]|uniref:DUF3616 domain-containing protein n=1 Tax=Leucobacter weissii TaxID=1983706 RepID=A0A939MGP5_9MICO|nr:DUF3616 domain-containing protein [Leucobacter weissii]MBO1900569.1 DUF3616 domain-containing protein [Leucobacter weissii]
MTPRTPEAGLRVHGRTTRFARSLVAGVTGLALIASGFAGASAASAVTPAPASGVVPQNVTESDRDSIRINEVRSNPNPDFVELVNIGDQPIDLNGWRVADTDHAATPIVTATQVIEPGGFYQFNPDGIPGGFGLGSSDLVSIYSPSGIDPVDSYSWTSHRNPSWQRCANGTGAWALASASTPGAANSCAQTASSTALAVSGELETGKPITLTASLAPSTALGTVAFKDGDTVLGTAHSTAGHGSLETTLTAGTHSITAEFTPMFAGDFSASASAAQTVEIEDTGEQPGDRTIQIVTAQPVTAGSAFDFTVAGFSPNESFELRLAGDPVIGLGQFTADGAGGFTGQATIPGSTAGGAKTVEAVAASGSASAPLQVTALPNLTLQWDNATVFGAVVGAANNPVVTGRVAGLGDASATTVEATAVGNAQVIATSDVTGQIDADGGFAVRVVPHGVGTSSVTLTFTASDGRTTTGILTYRVSAALPAGATAYHGLADASAAQEVGDGYLLVADDDTNGIRLYGPDGGLPVKTFDFSASGTNQVPALKSGEEWDLESSARIGDTIYWVGSIGNTRKGNIRADRDSVIATRITGSGADTVLEYVAHNQNIRQSLIGWDTSDAHGYGANFFALQAGTQSGVSVTNNPRALNVEGAAIAPDGQTLWLGFRSPVVRPQDAPSWNLQNNLAVIAAVTDVAGLVASGRTTAASVAPKPILLDLGGRAIRDLTHTDDGKYLIAAGSYGNDRDFAIYGWDGSVDANGRATNLVRSAQTPDLAGWAGSYEALPGASGLSDGTQIRVLQDVGTVDLYGDGTEAQDLSPKNVQKFPVHAYTLDFGGAFEEAQTVQTTTGLAVSGNRFAGQELTLTASVSPAAAAGSVEFRDGDHVIGSQEVAGGAATLRTSALAAGEHSLTAVFTSSDEAAYLGSASEPVALTIGQDPFTIRLNEVKTNPNPDFVELINIGDQPIDINGWRVNDSDHTPTPIATVSTIIEPGGFYQFNPDAIPGGFGLGANDAVKIYLPDGTTLVDEYSWTSHRNPSWQRCPAGTGEWVLSAVATPGAANQCPAVSTATVLEASGERVEGEPLTLTATVAPADAAGAVEFRDGAAVLGTETVSGGAASVTTTSLTAGGHTLTAVFTPADPGAFTASTSDPVSVAIAAKPAVDTVTQLAVSGDRVEGETLSLTATVTPAAPGSVEFFNGSALLGSSGTSAGVASATATLPAGTHQLRAVFEPANPAAFTGSTSSVVSVTVAEKPVGPEPEKATPQVSVTAAKTSLRYGQANTASVTVRADGAAAAGKVRVLFAGTSVATVDLSAAGAARVALPKTVKPGARALTAEYLGSDTVAAGRAQTTVRIAKAAPAVSAKLAKKSVKRSQKARVAVTVKLPGAGGVHAAGKVRVLDGKRTVKTVTLKASRKGKISIALPKLKKGSHKLRVVVPATATQAQAQSKRLTLRVR